MIISVILVLFWLICIPYVFGRVLTNNNDNTVLFSWVIGNVFQMAIFFVIAIVLILNRISFSFLWISYMIIMIVLFILSKIFFQKNIFLKPKLGKINIFKIIAIILVLTQLFIKVKYTNINNDDSSFVVLSTSMIETGKMYYSEENEELNVRRALAPISAYYATIAKQTGIHVTIITHSVIPVLFIAMSYIIYYHLGMKIFKDQENIWIMLILLSLLNIYTFSLKSFAYYMLLYTWLGRVVLVGIVLPLIWCLAFDAMNDTSNWKTWFFIFLSVLSGCLGSEMAVAIIPIVLMSLPSKLPFSSFSSPINICISSILFTLLFISNK